MCCCSSWLRMPIANRRCGLGPWMELLHAARQQGQQADGHWARRHARKAVVGLAMAVTRRRMRAVCRVAAAVGEGRLARQVRVVPAPAITPFGLRACNDDAMNGSAPANIGTHAHAHHLGWGRLQPMYLLLYSLQTGCRNGSATSHSSASRPGHAHAACTAASFSALRWWA